MFTGIIERIGHVKGVKNALGGIVMSIDIGPLSDGTCSGDSIAINGVCLTVSKLSGVTADFDVSRETLEKTTTNQLRSGSRVNLERAMQAGGRFGGHIVQGHVDGIGKIKGIRKSGQFSDFQFTSGKSILDQVILKGSVAIDGISLTVAKKEVDSFWISVIPTTLAETTLSKAKAGSTVNIETDIIVKTVQSQLGRMLQPGGGLTADKLREMGF